MELDIGQARAFVALADHLHFGRAAEQLFISQQGLSKRIQRIESALGQQLVSRGSGGVELTPAGRRFLPHARQVLATADAATAAMRGTAALSARIDVWGQIQAPLRIVRRFNQAHPELVLQLSMRRGMVAALEALGRQELDAAFGRPHDLDQPWPDGLARRPAYLEPLAAAVVEDHPLAGATVLRPGDLRRSGLWWPIVGSPAELLGFIRRYGGEHDIPTDLSGPNLGLDQFLSDLRQAPERVTLLGMDWILPPDMPLRRIPIEPTPCYPWQVVWPAGRPHPVVGQLLDFLAATSRAERWLDGDPGHVWIPEVDRADFFGPSA
jgi:DNA-binding transcriptional LysR family regulator